MSGASEVVILGSKDFAKHVSVSWTADFTFENFKNFVIRKHMER